MARFCAVIFQFVILISPRVFPLSIFENKKDLPRSYPRHLATMNKGRTRTEPAKQIFFLGDLEMGPRQGVRQSIFRPMGAGACYPRKKAKEKMETKRPDIAQSLFTRSWSHIPILGCFLVLL